MNKDEQDFVFEGNMSQAWIFRCKCCPKVNSVESTRGRLTQETAGKWAREEGWIKTKDGWKCPECAHPAPTSLTYDEQHDWWVNEKGQMRFWHGKSTNGGVRR